jgi:stage II sporulation protein P
MRRFLMIGFMLCGLLMGIAPMAMAQDELDGQFFTLKDSGGKTICRTAHRLVVGDRYLTSANRLYEVTKVDRLVARAKVVPSDSLFAQAQTAMAQWWQAQTAPKARGPVCIYHTHTDEAYLPTEGVNSKKVRGGVVDVGTVIAKELEKKGVPVIHSDTSHVPHDSMAYDRSRRTAAQLLKQQPAVILDIHRDAVPRSEYLTKINNRPTARIQLVVGRQNPNFAANNAYAKKLKATVDRQCPGLVKGIYYGKGKYNQDLGPRAMLLECGTNTCSEAEAIRGARIFTAAATNVLYGTAGNYGSNRGSWQSVGWILLVVGGIIGFFLLINRRGLSKIGREFGGDDDDRNSG